jgi:PqqA peptide cyclase
VLAAVEQAEKAAAAPRLTEHPLVFRDPANSRRLAKAST